MAGAGYSQTGREVAHVADQLITASAARHAVADGLGTVDVAAAPDGVDLQGVGLPFGQPLLWETLGGTVAAGTLFALLGVGVGAALRNQVVAIVGVLAVQVVVENSVFSASATVGRWLPFRAGDALRQFPTDGLLTVDTAVLALAAWIAVVLGVGVTRTVRSDVT